jgi:cyd operon protein YbgT
MWYFSWVLGLGLACSFAVLNAMWLEVRDDDGRLEDLDDSIDAGVTKW